MNNLTIQLFASIATCVLSINAAADSCVGDLNGDHAVSGSDLGTLLGQWGQPGSGDLDGNGVVGGSDLGLLLGDWGNALPPSQAGPLCWKLNPIQPW